MMKHEKIDIIKLKLVHARSMFVLLCHNTLRFRYLYVLSSATINFISFPEIQLRGTDICIIFILTVLLCGPAHWRGGPCHCALTRPWLFVFLCCMLHDLTLILFMECGFITNTHVMIHFCLNLVDVGVVGCVVSPFRRFA